MTAKSLLGYMSAALPVYSRRARHFAPLDKAKGEPPGAVKLQGIIFDVDGTLCEPQNYMFTEMREALGIPKSVDILDHINSLPTQGQQDDAQKKIQAIELRAMDSQKPQPGLTELMDYLDTKGIRKGICTRNFDLPINHLLDTFLPKYTFAPIITRAFKPPKPDPAGILHISESWSLEDRGERLVMVGDSMDDMRAGRRAGALTVLLANNANVDCQNAAETDVSIARLDDLIPLLQDGLGCGE